ncbi:TM2 domain-containing protein [uncultured Campylobacter sp.]|uniref:TM2 domain-containing protein n=1 Tax=uncultured Campylobacter sp. TaxID=218934 RepID=UPI003211B7A6
MGNSYLLFKGKVSDAHLMIVKNELDRAEAAGDMPDLKPLTSQLKSPILGLIISILFGFIGFDRFYKGDGGAGVLKLVLAVGMARASKTNPDEAAIALAALLLWWLADIFLVYFGIKKDNFKKISAFFLG